MGKTHCHPYAFCLMTSPFLSPDSASFKVTQVAGKSQLIGFPKNFLLPLKQELVELGACASCWPGIHVFLQGPLQDRSTFWDSEGWTSDGSFEPRGRPQTGRYWKKGIAQGPAGPQAREVRDSFSPQWDWPPCPHPRKATCTSTPVSGEAGRGVLVSRESFTFRPSNGRPAAAGHARGSQPG